MKPQDLRNEIPALEDGVYLNTGASGPCPRPVVDAMCASLERIEYDAPTDDGAYTVPMEVADSAREAIASHVGATTDELALTQSTADGINRIAGAFDWKEGDVVVRTDLEHPAGILPWRRLEREYGVEVRVLETRDGRLDLDDVKSVADEADLFCVSSITWTHGTRLPVREIVDVARDGGAATVVDAVQSPGQTTVDVTEWSADYVAGASHKWLLGTFGAGFLYVREGAERELVPSAIGYRSVEDPNAHEYEYAPGAKRFEIGTTSPVPHAGTEAAIDLIESIGLDVVENRIERLTDRLKDGLPSESVLSPDSYESGLVTVAVDNPEETVERLEANDVHVRSLPYPDAIRASLHVFNTVDDVDILLNQL